MKAPTYQEQERKIHEAYIRGDMQPYDAKFCFCGTLANGSSWYKADKIPELHSYNGNEYFEMEYALLGTIQRFKGFDGMREQQIMAHPEYEDALFDGMVAALEVLKKIHEIKGEIIDTEPIFTKRKLTSHALPL